MLENIRLTNLEELVKNIRSYEMADLFEIKDYKFTQDSIDVLGNLDTREKNWPVVYSIYNKNNIYIGETTNLKNRMNQHIANTEKESLNKGSVRVVVGDTFNKSVALDLESYLIRYFSGDGKYNVLNRNDGLSDHNYYHRKKYREMFEDIWNRLRELGIADKTIKEINNSEIFKFSPYKSLNFEQLNVVTEIVQNIDEAIANKRKSLSVIGGKYGTGKSIVIMYLTKLIADLQTFDNKNDDIDDESNFKLFFENEQFNKRFKNKRIALVIPSQSLKGRIEAVFKKSRLGEADIQIFSPISFGQQEEDFDITLVDEAHLLKVGEYNMQGKTLEDAKRINKRLFNDGEVHTELDWIMKKSKDVVLVYSFGQRVRPGNITDEDVEKYYIKNNGRTYELHQQMRSEGGELFIDYIDSIFSTSFHPYKKERFEGFDAKIFYDFRKFQKMVQEREEEFGLSRMVAGFAWEWKTAKQGYDNTYDIEIDGVKLKWNKTLSNWLGSKRSKDEVGSIYTIQGDDLNYVGVIIGNELKRRKGRMVFDKKYYADKGAMRRSRRQIINGETLTDEDLLNQVLRIYRVLLSRGIKGVYIYACDKELRDYLSKYFDVVG